MNMHIEWTQNQARISELKAENAQLLEVISAHNKKMSEGVYTTNEQCAKEVAEHDRLLAENAAQAKRIAELEAATEHLGLTPQQAADGLARHKAQVAEIESLRKQIEGIAIGIQKHFGLTESDLKILMLHIENGE